MTVFVSLSMLLRLIFSVKLILFIRVLRSVILNLNKVGINIVWRGKNKNEVGINKITGKILVRVDPRYYRPLEVPKLIGNYNKSKKIIKWKPKIKIDSLIEEMVFSDLKNIDNL